MASDPEMSQYDHAVINRDIVLVFYLLKLSHEAVETTDSISRALVTIEKHLKIPARLASLQMQQLKIPTNHDNLTIVSSLMKLSHGIPEFVAKLIVDKK